MRHLFAVMFVIVSVIHLIGCLVRQPNWLRRISKPLLMLSLTASYCVLADDIHLLVIFALLFACAGDTLLLFPSSNMCFVCGGICFCLCHISYILIFLSDTKSLVSSPILIAGLFCLYAVAVYIVLRCIRDSIPRRLSVPVKGYLILVAAMGICAFIRSDAMPSIGKLIWIGSVFFLISDSILLYDKFKYNGKHSRAMSFTVMFTYLLAQSLIVRGIC